MKKINIKFLFLFQTFLIYIKSKLIVIPLKKATTNNYESESENIMREISSNIYYTELSIGEPNQRIISFINSTAESNFGIINNYCDNRFYLNNSKISKHYEYQNSKTFYQISEGDMNLGAKDILIKDEITFYTNFNYQNDLTEEIKVGNISILYNPNNYSYIIDDVEKDYINEREKKIACGYIGLRLEMDDQKYKNNIIVQLKEKGIISKTIFTFLETNKKNEKFKNNNIDYLLVIGEEIYDIFSLENINNYISDKYNKDKYIEKIKINDYILDEFYFMWKLKFNDVYYNLDNNTVINMKNMNNIFLYNNYGIITGTYEYRKSIKENFFNNYFINNKCIERNTSTYEIGAFYYYVCDDDININNFPTLYLKSKNLQYIFQLTKDDIFIKVKNKIYFLIIFEFSRTNTWVLGKPFLNKYLFSYNYDAKTISFYNENLLEESENNNNNNYNDNNNKKYIILFIIIVLSLIALVLGFIIGRYIYYKRKNKRALELDESLNNNYIDEEGKNKEKKDITIN